MGTGDGVSLRTWKRTALYRLYDADDALLYVGIAFELSRRYNQHRKTKAWWPEVARKEVCWYEDRTQAEQAEVAAIRSEKPRYNIAHVDDPVRVPDLPRHTPPTPGQIEMKALLHRASRAAARAEAAKNRTRAKLRATILEAAALGLGPAEICRVIDYHLSEGHVARVIKGKA